MIELEKRALAALSQCSMRIASAGKRFRNDMVWKMEHEPAYKLTKGQALYLWYLVDMYRRQIKDTRLRELGAQRKITGELPEGIYLEGDLRELPAEKKPQREAPTICQSTVTHKPCGGGRKLRCSLPFGHEGQHAVSCSKHHACLIQWSTPPAGRVVLTGHHARAATSL